MRVGASQMPPNCPRTRVRGLKVLLELTPSGRTDDAGARDVQELCMKIALASIETEPAVLGVFLWKWFVPPRSVGRNFQLATPRTRRVIRESWDR